MIWHGPTHQPTHPNTHPPNHTPTQRWGISTDFKSSNRIEISRFVQDLLNFYWFGGSSHGGLVGGWDCKWVGATPTYVHTWIHIHMHVHTPTHMLIMISILVAICNFFTCIFYHVCACKCMYECVHVGAPSYIPRYFTPPLPLPPERGPQISKNAIKLEDSRYFNSVWRFGTFALSCTHID